MIFVEWEVPGWRLEEPDLERKGKIEHIFVHIESAIVEANVALNFFMNERERIHSKPSSQELFEIKCQFEKETRAEHNEDYLESSKSSDRDWQIENARAEARVRKSVRQKLLSAGILPFVYESKIAFLFALAFVRSLDRFEKHFLKLREEFATKDKIDVIIQNFRDSVPDLRGIRDSTEHMDERIHGMAHIKGKRGKIALEPFTPLINESLHGNKLIGVMANGKIGRIEITAETLHSMVDALLESYQLFEWRKPPENKPW